MELLPNYSLITAVPMRVTAVVAGQVAIARPKPSSLRVLENREKAARFVSRRTKKCESSTYLK